MLVAIVRLERSYFEDWLVRVLQVRRICSTQAREPRLWQAQLEADASAAKARNYNVHAAALGLSALPRCSFPFDWPLRVCLLSHFMTVLGNGLAHNGRINRVALVPVFSEVVWSQIRYLTYSYHGVPARLKAPAYLVSHRQARLCWWTKPTRGTRTVKKRLLARRE